MKKVVFVGMFVFCVAMQSMDADRSKKSLPKSLKIKQDKPDAYSTPAVRKVGSLDELKQVLKEKEEKKQIRVVSSEKK